MKSVGPASMSESDKIYRRKRAAILWISDFFLFKFHFGKTIILQENDFYRQALVYRRAQFRHQHRETAIADDRD